MKVYTTVRHAHSLGPKETGHKINSAPMQSGMESGPYGPGHGVIIVGRRYSVKPERPTEGSQYKGKSPGSGVSELKLSTLVTRLFTAHNIGPADRYNGLIRVISDVELLTLCYMAVRRTKGANTPGTSAETLDGMTRRWIERTSVALRSGSWNFSPARRVRIPKPGKSGSRPLGIGNPREKIVQKALHVALEHIYEPKFLPCSHGFRPHRGCHSALRELRYKGAHHTWVIEGDIEKCFDSIPHRVILRLLQRQVRCDKTLTLLIKSLRVGYREANGRMVKPDVGTPQGSVVSPLLSNIVLHEFDRYMTAMKRRVEIGRIRRVNPAWRRVYRSKALTGGARRNLLRATPSRDPLDPNYRRLTYVRYADDFVVLVSASRHYADQLRTRMARFLSRLGLTLSPTKTRLTPLRHGVHFLGADLRCVRSDAKIMKHVVYTSGARGKRRVNQRLRLLAPLAKLLTRLKDAKFIRRRAGSGTLVPTAKRSLLAYDHADILAHYNQKIRGLLNYYSFAGNRGQMHRVLYFLIMSCALTLALKYKLRTARATFRRFGRVLKDPKSPFHLYRPTGLKTVHRYNVRLAPESPDEIIERSWANKLTRSGLDRPCALCQTSPVEMHHVRSVKRARARMRTQDLTYAQWVGAFRRKQIPLCADHHRELHAGRLSKAQLDACATYGG